MKSFVMKTKVIILFSIFVLSGLLAMVNVNAETQEYLPDESVNPNDSGGSSRGSSRAEDYVSRIRSYNDLNYDSNNPTSLQGLYAGEEDIDFYIRIYEDNNGDENTGDSHPSGWDNYLHNTTIKLESIRDEKGEVLSNPPITWTSGRNIADDNSPDGWTVAWDENFYVDDSSNLNFQFNINNDLTPGIYQVEITVRYKIIIDYNSGSGATTYSSWRTDTEFMKFEIRSGLWYTTPYNTFDLKCYDDYGGQLNNGIFYAGSQFQEARIYINDRAWDNDNTLESLEATCGSSQKISVYDSATSAKIVSINYGSTSFFRFRVNVKSTASPGIFQCPLTFKYKRGIGGLEKQITEAITTEFIIDFTPILEPPETGTHMTNSLTTIYQGEPEETFDIEFTNSGNVDFQDLKISLDISRANYFSGTEFYYDEGNYGNEVLFPLTAEISNTLPIGGKSTVSFETTVFKLLPPGIYRIPIQYDGKYLDTGEITGSSGYTTTNQWEYQVIKTAMREESPDDLPYIAIKVIDSDGLNMDVEALSTLTTGEQNVMFSVSIQNREYYDLMDLVATLDAWGMTPILNPDNKNRRSLEPVYIGNLGPRSTTTISFVANVKDNEHGTYYIPMQITGNDTHNNFVMTKNLELKLTINPDPPSFIVAGLTTTQIKPGETFKLEVTVKNTGGSTASDIKGTILSSNNIITAQTNGALTTDSLNPGNERIIGFDMITSPTIELGEMYNVDLSIEYNDIQNNSHMTTKSLTIKTGEIEPLSPGEIFVVTNMESTDIRAGEAFTLSISLRNVGEKDIQNAFVTVSSSTPFLYHSPPGTSPGTISTGFIGVGNSTIATFEMMAGSDIDQGREYNCSIIITYIDSEGNLIYSPDDIKPLPLKVKYEGKSPSEIRKEEIETEKTTIDMSSLLIAIIILIGFIIFPIILRLVIFKGRGVPKPKEKEPSEKKPSPPKEPSNKNINITRSPSLQEPSSSTGQSQYTPRPPTSTGQSPPQEPTQTVYFNQ
jgi:hypothetical protein